MDYDSITIDTSIFDNHSLNLESGILNQLTQFKNGYTHFILSEIVIREVHRHLMDRTREAKISLARAINNVTKYKVAPDDIVEQLCNIQNSFSSDEHTVKNRLTSFIKETGAEIISADLVNIKDLTEHYFDSLPPFVERGKKKNEFPDAIALLSLEQWAKDKQLKVLAVSKDKGWHKFATESEWIDIEEDLTTALSKLQHAEAASDFVAKFIADLDNGDNPEMMQKIREFITDKVAGYLSNFVEAVSEYYFETEYIDIEVDNLTFLKSGDKYHSFLVQIGNKLIVTSIMLSVSVTANGWFTFSLTEPTDKDYTYIGDGGATVESDIDVEILVTLEGDFSDRNNDYRIKKVELVVLAGNIDFGDIGPDIRNSA